MTTRLADLARPRTLAPLPVLVAVGAAWSLAVLAAVSGTARTLHHHDLVQELVEGGPRLWAALGLFLVAWQTHIAAMMLPSSLPLIGLFDRVAAGQPGARQAWLLFLGGYAAVWTAFGALAFTGDAVVHRVTHAVAWLAASPWLLGGWVLVLAGLFQFSALKDRCLRECRHPGGFLVRYYRRGRCAAFALGVRHGLFCLGCCWALMLVMLAAGIANLAWMAPLTLLMLYEKTGPSGERATRPIGLALIALGALVQAHPAWLPPSVFGG